mmetsp:Transcript_39242/g.91706  ORF Transcript_39242/g.91706 Transcript_39242/m.91706 type:complete len:219 (-) Transcript_39242:282-938(-)
MGGVCSGLVGKGVHEPKVVRHEIKGDHAIVVNKHDARHHPTQVQQLFTATYENPSESGIDAPVIASGHTAKKHFHVDENGRAHHKVLREEKGHHKQDWSKSQSYDCAGGPHRAAHSRTPRGRRERRSSVPLFFDDEDPGNKTDGLASAGLLAFALEKESYGTYTGGRRRSSARSPEFRRRQSSAHEADGRNVSGGGIASTKSPEDAGWNGRRVRRGSL